MRVEEEEEDDVPLSSLRSLLPFESKYGTTAEETSPPSSNILKSWGDELLRLRDYSSAASHYEAALALTSFLEIGGNAVLNVGGRPVMAEVDCIDGNAVDLCYPNGEETTKKIGDLLICIPGDCSERYLQVRVLLNLSRCLLRLAEVDNSGPSTRSDHYRKSAVMGCTLAIACFSLVQTEEKDEVEVKACETLEKARLVRASAYVLMGKTKHAAGDLRWVLKQKPNHKEALKLKRDLERKASRMKKVDKKLVKEMSGWVQRATNEATSDSPNGSGNNSSSLVSEEKGSFPNSKEPFARNNFLTNYFGSMSWIMWFSILALFAAAFSHCLVLRSFESVY